MTFTELVTEIMDRLNLSSTEATARVGRALNRKYKLVTSAVGLQLSRRATVQQAVTIGVSTVIFTNAEKVINVYNRTVTPYRLLEEVTIDEIRESQPYTTGSSPSKYAIASHTADTISVEINCTPQTAFVLYADVHAAVATLSGSQEPAFPESFHDVLIEGVMADELRKMEKAALAGVAKGEYERILSDLRMWIAKNNALDIYQGKTAQNSPRSSVGSSSSGSVNGALSWTQTGLITFDRDPAAPFAVTASSAVVPNLDADKLDGFDESAFAKLADNETVTGSYTFSTSLSASGGALILPQVAVPAQTAEGSIVWDTNDDLLTVGTGASRKIMVDLDSTQTLTNKSIVASQINSGTLTAARAVTILSTTSTGTQNDFAPGTLTAALILLRCNNASTLSITGIAGGVDGQMLRIVSIGAGEVQFSHESGSSTALNRFINFITTIPTRLSPAVGTATFVYDGTTARWRLIEHEQGAPSVYTPVWVSTGTQPALGNGTITGNYTTKGKLVFYDISFTVGGTSTFGTGSYGWTLPIAASGGQGRSFTHGWNAQDVSAGSIVYMGTGSEGVIISDSVTPFVTAATGLVTASSSASPFTWATGDFIFISGHYWA